MLSSILCDVRTEVEDGVMVILFIADGDGVGDSNTGELSNLSF